MESRLPRLQASPPPPPAINSLKRKARSPSPDDEDAYESLDQPRKLPALGPTRPIRAVRAALQPTLNLSKKPAALPKPLTKPRPPTLTAPRTGVRGTSAPPVNGPATRSGAILRGPANTRARARVASSAGPRPDPFAADMAAERSKHLSLQAAHQALSNDFSAARAQELATRRELVLFSDEIEALKKKHAVEFGEVESALASSESVVRSLTSDLATVRANLESERKDTTALRAALAIHETTQQELETKNVSLMTQVAEHLSTIAFLRTRLDEAERRVSELQAEVLEGELVRRQLHNTVLELKGNIRVFARVRPVLSSDAGTGETGDIAASIAFPDADTTSLEGGKREIVLSSTSESAMGNERREEHKFRFDHVFGPHAGQAEVFEEIEMLVGSCMDGFNVCVFAYGQTGSGKSFTMEGVKGDVDGEENPDAGMIPRAVEQVFRVAQEMSERKGWTYTIEGQFLEIYNETIVDLLSPIGNEKKHEIKHDPKTHATRVTDLTVVPLHCAAQVHTLLGRANARRSVAATLMNERSSRSHSVFTLRIAGSCEHGDRRTCEGSLNLVDLAGSERIHVSFGRDAGGKGTEERLKETKSINKSLSALGDVIAALGERGQQGGEGAHIPYRNSKLTYLLQNSLSGNSKTLMFVNLSPLAAHLNESLTSLRFATKVNHTHVGTAKRHVKTSS